MRFLLAAGTAVAGLAGAAAGAELRLDLDQLGPFSPGNSVVVIVSMADLGGEEAVGFQAFLSFDSGQLSFQGGTYLASPFGLPVIPIIQAVGEDIDMASGVDFVNGQPGTSADGELAKLFFQALVPLCEPEIIFRDHDPPTRITDDLGNEILPLVLSEFPPVSDCNGNDVEDACDIDEGASRDCNFDGIPDECQVLTCPADITGPGGEPDGVVDIVDFLELLAQWGGSGCADFTGPVPGVPDGVVSILDFLELLAAWGPC